MAQLTKAMMLSPEAAAFSARMVFSFFELESSSQSRILLISFAV